MGIIGRRFQSWPVEVPSRSRNVTHRWVNRNKPLGNTIIWHLYTVALLILCLFCCSPANKEGPWSKKEVQRLLRAVRDHIMSQIPGAANGNMSIRVMKETLYKRLPLQRIATKVKTRSWSQCREKWWETWFFFFFFTSNLKKEMFMPPGSPAPFPQYYNKMEYVVTFSVFINTGVEILFVYLLCLFIYLGWEFWQWKCPSEPCAQRRNLLMYKLNS